MELLIALLVSLNVVSAEDAKNLSLSDAEKLKNEIWVQEAEDFRGDDKGTETKWWVQEAEDF